MITRIKKGNNNSHIWKFSNKKRAENNKLFFCVLRKFWSNRVKEHEFIQKKNKAMIRMILVSKAYANT